MNIEGIITVLKVGNSIQNPELWKKLQNLINLIFGMAGVIAFMFPSVTQYLTPENLISITTGITAINAYLTTATSTKVGYTGKTE